ncbi:MAG TPA: Smr/MutS family protein [Vicinamibacterales bacterium]|nr:Smr/MutS family protein [Vicinamibacterales bacterium]
MNPAFYKALEFDRVREALAAEAMTALGRARALELEPATEPEHVQRRLALTGEAVAFLKGGGSLGIDAPEDLDRILAALDVIDQPLEPLQLVGLCRFLRSVGHAVDGIRRAEGTRLLRDLVAEVASFSDETAAVGRAVDPSGDVTDEASPALADIRDKLRRQRSKLRASLESLTRGRDTAKYLQDQIITDRNGRYVVVVRAEHRDAIPGLVHGASASGASLYLEPLSTVSLNNDVVALAERERQEIHRILLALSNAFRLRADELEGLFEAAAEVDAVQARARLAQRVDGVAPSVVTDGRLEFRGARHPLLIPAVRDLLERSSGGGRDATDGQPGPRVVVASDLVIEPPARALVISGPNTGGKTVALKAFGLLALMAQAGLFIPVEPESAFTPFKSVFAEIGDEQSISASLSTFSARIANIVDMERALVTPSLVLLDEVGSGTDPAEGGALGTAVIDHFRRRGALVVATTHDDALKSYAATTEGVAAGAFGFNPDTYAPTYRLMYGAPGRSLALEVAERLGMPADIIADARARRSTRESQLAAHLARVDAELVSLERARETLEAERALLKQGRETLLARESRLAEREAVLKKRFDDKLGERLREARAEVDEVVARLRQQAAALTDQASRRARAPGPVLTTGELGGLRAAAREALDSIGETSGSRVAEEPPGKPLTGPPADGTEVFVTTFGTTGVVKAVSGKQVEVDVRGKRLRVPLDSLRHAPEPAPKAATSESGRRSPRPGAVPDGGRPAELMVIGSTVEQAIARAEKFLDDALLSDTKRLRVIHGHGTGRLREALTKFFRGHPLVASVERAPDNEGGGGATIVELKD